MALSRKAALKHLAALRASEAADVGAICSALRAGSPATMSAEQRCEWSIPALKGAIQ